MKLLFILNTTIMGGATISLMNLVSGLINENVKIVIIAPNLSKDFQDFINKYRITFYKLPIRICVLAKSNCKSYLFYYRLFRFLMSRLKHFKDYLKLCSIIKKELPDIIHTNDGIVQDGFYAAKKYGIPHVWHLREYQDLDFDWDIFPTKRKFCELLKKSYVISISKDILKHFKLEEDFRHRVIYNGILDKNNIVYNPHKNNFFLCASRISREKGHIDVIKAFSIVHKKYPQFRLKILGFGKIEFINELKLLSKTLECEKSIDFIGYTKNVSLYMREAKALIVASKFEGFGRMTAEAYFNGCIVIGRNTGGTKEILDLTQGIIFSDNYKELAKKMIEVIDMKKQDYEKQVLKGQKIVQNLFSNENNVSSTYRFYKNILSEQNFKNKQIEC